MKIKEVKSNRGIAKLAVALSLMLSLALTGCGVNTKGSVEDVDSSSPETTKTQSSASSSPQKIKQGDELVIRIGDITETAKLYPIKVDGTAMEVLAVKASDGSIRTAFNTCEVCYDSGRGYYKQEGDELVCQNCGNRFSTSQVEVESRGCNPWPIFKENKTITEDTITISYDYLLESTKVFANWKRS